MTDVSVFRRAVDALQPNATGRTLVTLLDGRAKRNAALHWYAGRRHAPTWALKTLSAKLKAKHAAASALADELERLPDRLGRAAGATNLARWKAHRFDMPGN